MKKSSFKYIIFVIYIFVVLKLTIFRETTLSEREVNLTLFQDLINVYKTRTTWQFIRLFVGNIVWFVPWGFLIPMIYKNNKFFVFLSGFAFSLAIEILQFALKKGLFEIDDLILNTMGAIIGYFLYLFAMKFKCIRNLK
jgi:glycopeptide antibiotics resistance protein